jgi:hypothetical protein
MGKHDGQISIVVGIPVPIASKVVGKKIAVKRL